MAKIALSALACFLLIAVVQGVDPSFGSRGRAMAFQQQQQQQLHLQRLTTAKQECTSRGYRNACWGKSDYLCQNLKCVDLRGQVVPLGNAATNTWCDVGKVCRNGRCEAQTQFPEPQNHGPSIYSVCPGPPRPRGS